MAREFFKDLPNTTTPLTASRLNGLLNGDEALGSIVVDDVSGKNLFDGLLELGQYNQSNGNKMDATNLYRNVNKIAVLPNTTYTISIDGVKQQYIMFYYGNNDNFLSYYDNRTGTFTTPNNCYYIAFRCFVADFTSDFANLKVQLEEGSTVTEYTEFKQPVKKTSAGVKEDCTFYANDFKCKNLFSGIMYNGIINQSGAYITNNARITNTTANGFFLPQGTYTLSIADLDACTIVIKNASGTVIQDLADSWKTLPFTFTTIQDGYICFSAKKNNDATLNPNDYAPQLEIGSEATSYTPYKNFENTTIEYTDDIIVGSNVELNTNEQQLYVNSEGLVVFNITLKATGTISGTQGVALFTLPTIARPKKNNISAIGKLRTTGNQYYMVNAWVRTSGQVAFQHTSSLNSGDEIAIMGMYYSRP